MADSAKIGELRVGDHIELPLEHYYTASGRYLGVVDATGKRIGRTVHQTINVLVQMVNAVGEEHEMA